MRDVDIAIRAEFDVIAAMTHAATAAHEFLALFKHTVAILVGQTKERLGIVGVREERTVRVEQPAALQQLVVDDFDLLIAAAAERETQQTFLFFAKREAALRIEGHGDPRILTRLRGADQLGFETGRQRESGRIGGLILCAGLGELPGVVGVEGFLQIEGIRGRIGVGGAEHLRVFPRFIRHDPAHGSEVTVEFEQGGGFGLRGHTQADLMRLTIAELSGQIRAGRAFCRFHLRHELPIDRNLQVRSTGG